MYLVTLNLVLLQAVLSRGYIFFVCLSFISFTLIPVWFFFFYKVSDVLLCLGFLLSLLFKADLLNHRETQGKNFTGYLCPQGQRNGNSAMTTMDKENVEWSFQDCDLSSHLITAADLQHTPHWINPHFDPESRHPDQFSNSSICLINSDLLFVHHRRRCHHHHFGLV